VTTTRPGGVEDRYGQPLEATRRGAHRARPTFVEVLLPSLAVLGVIAIVATVTWVLLKGVGGGSSSTDAGSADTSTSAPATASAKPSASAATHAATHGPTHSATAKASASPSVTKPAAVVVNKKAKLIVLNGTTTAGLAKKASAALTDNGWTVGSVGNYSPKGAVKQTTVFYASGAQAATAKAVAAELGVVAQQSDTKAAKGITVILGPDYQP